MQPWSGIFHIEPGRALYVGPAFETAAHAHHAFQICIGLDGPFELRRGSARLDGPLLTAVVQPDETHSLNAFGRSMALLYVEPESRDGQRLALAPALPRERLGELRQALIASPGVSEQTGALLVQTILRAFAAGPAESVPLDQRIAQALALLRAADLAYPSSRDVAGHVGLSPGRFRHLFREQIGLSYRSNLLWLRLCAAVENLRRGTSLTTAAHAAGFADSAHLTRTYRRMFGVTPSSLAPALGGRARRAAPDTTPDSRPGRRRRDRPS